MTKASDMPHSLRRFLRTALPMHGDTSHVLALGEYHDEVEHIEYLREKLPYLKNRHRLGVIGIEGHMILNVFFQAYQEGLLGNNRTEIRAYLAAVMDGFCSDPAIQNRYAFIDLAMDAMDAGIKVVAFDSRVPLDYEENTFTHWAEQFKQRALEFSAQRGIASGQTFQNAMRTDAELRKQFFAEQMPSRGEHIFWAIHEAQAWMQAHPSLASTISCMRQLQGVYNSAYHNANPDFTSALIFRACCPRNQNAITISGIAHIARATNNAVLLDGHFADHLGRIALPDSPAPGVTASIIGGVGMLKKSAAMTRHVTQDIGSTRLGKPLEGFVIPYGFKIKLPRPERNTHIGGLTVTSEDNIAGLVSYLQQPWDAPTAKATLRR